MYIHIGWLVVPVVAWIAWRILVVGPRVRRCILYVLRGAPQAGMSGRELSRACGMSVPYTLLNRLEDEGYVRRTIDVQPITIGPHGYEELKIHRFHLASKGKDLIYRRPGAPASL